MAGCSSCCGCDTKRRKPFVKATPYRDPVCGKKVPWSEDRRLEVDGKCYFFCSTKCMTEFVAKNAARK